MGERELIGLVSEGNIRGAPVPRLGSDIIEGYKALTDHAGLVARALDQLGLSTSVPAARLPALKPGSFVVGQAVTVRNIPEAASPYKAWQDRKTSSLGEREAYFLAKEGDVVVIDGSSVHPASCLGSASTKLAETLGIAGIVVNGCVTGVAGIKACNIPVWAVGGTTITGHQRVQTVEINGPIGLAGVRVDPGDLIVADDSGVTAVPLGVAAECLEVARRLMEAGRGIKALLAQGSGSRADLKEALRRQMQEMKPR